MEKQLQSLGLQHNFVQATNGHQISEDTINEIYDPKLAQNIHGHQLSRTQIACADSHRRIYEMMKSQNLPWALILEDDVILDKRVVSLLNDEFILSSGADWLQIDYLPFNLQFIKHWFIATFSRTKKSPLFLIYAIIKLPFLIGWGLFEYVREVLSRIRKPVTARFPRPLYLASAYIITAKGVSKILPLCTPIRYAADQIQNRARIKSKLVLRGIIPLLAKQDRTQFESNLLYDNQ